VREAGFKRWDVHSPFPIHGINEAMGVKRSILPYFVFLAGHGMLTAFLLAYITQCLIYPTVVQAKPANIFTTAAFFPIMFELTILFSAFTTVFGCFAFMATPAEPPAVRGQDLQEVLRRRLLHLHRGTRPEIPPGRDQGFP